MATGDLYLSGVRHSQSGQSYVRSDDVRGTPEFLALALAGKIAGIRRVIISGYNTDVDVATTPEDIFPAIESTLIPVIAAAEAWEIVSNNAADTSAGTGARTVTITTVNGSYQEVSQVVTLNGVTAVPLTGAHIAANSCVVISVGSGGVNLGMLTIRVAGGGAARAYVGANDGVLNQAKFTVPSGYLLELYSTVIGLTTNGFSEAARFLFVIANSAGRTLNTVRLPLFAGGTSIYRHELGGGLLPYNMITATNATSVRVAAVTQNNTSVDCVTVGLLYDLALWP